MKLSRPALISAFVFPGLGHWAAGWRLTGTMLVMLGVGSVLSPFGAMIWGITRTPDCFEGWWPCSKAMLAHGWGVAWPVLAVAAPLLVLVYVGALLHATRLTLPDRD